MSHSQARWLAFLGLALLLGGLVLLTQGPLPATGRASEVWTLPAP